MKIFIDESGDLGFSKKSSKVIVISAVVGKEKEFNKIFKKIRKNLLSKKELRRYKEFKYGKTSKRVKEKVIETFLKSERMWAFSICVNKKHIQTHLKKKKEISYNYFVRILLNLFKSDFKELDLVLDKRGGTFNEKNRKHYLKAYTTSKIVFRESHTSSGIQMADFIAGSVFACMNRKKCEFMNKLKKKNLIYEIFPDGIKFKKRI